MSIYIDYNSVMGSAEKIAGLNQEMRNDFSRVNSAMKTLDSAWNGTASGEAMRLCMNLRSNLVQHQSDVISDFVSFLQSCAAKGYIETEGNLSNAAKEFKEVK